MREQMQSSLPNRRDRQEDEPKRTTRWQNPREKRKSEEEEKSEE